MRISKIQRSVLNALTSFLNPSSPLRTLEVSVDYTRRILGGDAEGYGGADLDDVPSYASLSRSMKTMAENGLLIAHREWVPHDGGICGNVRVSYSLPQAKPYIDFQHAMSRVRNSVPHILGDDSDFKRMMGMPVPNATLADIEAFEAAVAHEMEAVPARYTVLREAYTIEVEKLRAYLHSLLKTN